MINQFHCEGDKSTDISGTGPIWADRRLVDLVVQNSDSRCGYVILDAFHEVLAKLIANSIQQGRVQIPATMIGEIQAHIRADSVCKEHHDDALEIAQEWAEGLTWKIHCYSASKTPRR